MKNFVLPILTLAAAVFISAKGCVPQCRKTTPLQITVTDSIPLEGVSVMVDPKSDRPLAGRTDENGDLTLFICSGDLGKEARVRVRSSIFRVDTQYFLRLENPMLIQVRVGKIEPEIVKKRERERKQMLDGMDKLGQFNDQLSTIDKAIENLEKDIDDYLKQHPGSTVADCKTMLSKRKEEVAALRERLLGIEDRYKTLLAKHKAGDDVDVDGLEKLQIEYEAKARDARQRWGASALTTRVNLALNPDEKIDFNVLFPSGKFKRADIRADKISLLDRCRQKIREGVSNLDDKTPQNIRFRLRATGYADGEPILPEWEQYLFDQCKGGKDHSHDDKNNCLSWLRANTVFEYIFEGAPKGLLLEKEVSGQGSSEATNPNDTRPELRRCDVSFSLIPIEQMRSKAAEYREGRGMPK